MQIPQRSLVVLVIVVFKTILYSLVILTILAFEFIANKIAHSILISAEVAGNIVLLVGVQAAVQSKVQYALGAV